MTATTREEALTDAELLDASSLEGAALAEAVAGLEADAAVSSESPQSPLITVVKGNPTDEEIAAVVTVLCAAAAAGEPVADSLPPETWGAPTRMHRGRAPFSPYSFGNPVAPRPF
ncbi:acyl-CoA carboxylase epsilon subunit-like protein [Rhodococcus sp. OK519]|uniref:acyl-CoA carboxylase subunit epsilon n=1 Tax=Rhodococcus sp. OK519 TaxID=2135729 RepID=UPI000D3647F0|nr:acyl-CoA carboxylase epsilon subunit-like protein [Rhodococcus sp. OK519]